MLTDENEGLKKENLSELKELFQKQDKRLEWFQQQNDKKFDELKELFQKQNDKKLDELKKLFQQQNDKKIEKWQREMENLKKELIMQILNTKKYENEITHLKKEVIELQEKLHAKTATNGTNDNHSLDAEINPNDYQFNHEFMVKEEVLGQNSDFQPDSVVKNEIIE